MVFAVHVYIEKKHQQCKLQRVIPAMCNWSICEKAPRIQLQPLLTTTTLVSSHSDLHWCWPCCFWPLHLNLLYTDSLAHTMHETSSATAKVITLLLYCFMHTINPLRTVYFCLVPQPIQTFFFVYPCVCDIIILNNISSHLSQHPSVDKEIRVEAPVIDEYYYQLLISISFPQPWAFTLTHPLSHFAKVNSLVNPNKFPQTVILYLTSLKMSLSFHTNKVIVNCNCLTDVHTLAIWWMPIRY